MKLNMIQHSWIFILVIVPLSLGYETNVEIIESRQSSGDLKESAEAEWAFFTEMFNFVNDDLRLNGTPWASYMLKFMNYRNGHEAFKTRMTETYYWRQKAQLCTAYLSDPIFKDNIIFLHTENPLNPITLDTRSVQFRYFSRKEVWVKVVGCPILIYTEESRIYFQEVNYNFGDFDGGMMRGYFVFESIGDYRSTKEIRILMYTPRNNIPLENPDLSGREIQNDVPEHMIEPAIQIPTFRISYRIIEDVITSHRAFGQVAEVYFLTKYYGFFNPLRTYWKVKNLILMMEHLRRGYEINVESMNLEMRNNRNKEMCLNHIKTNIHFKELGIFIRENLINNVVKWEIKQIKFPFLQSNFDDQPQDRKRKLLKCPAYFDEEKWTDTEHEYIYLLPIVYKIPIKPQKLFIFVESLNSSNTVHPVMLTPVNSHAFVDYGDDEFIGADESYSTDIPSITQSFMNLMDQ